MIKTLLNELTENTYIINEGKEAYIIDPGAKFDEIKQYVEEKELIVKGILLTHGHFDHILSCNDLIAEYDIPVYIHEKERDFLFDPNLNLSATTLHRFSIAKKSAVQTYTENDTFTLKNQQIKVLHTPGHTRGSSVFLYKRVCFAGDTLFKGTVGRTDLPTSSRSDLDKSLKKLVEKVSDNTVVYPGHGHFTTILTEKYENPFIRK